jgi:hypothetical protein
MRFFMEFILSRKTRFLTWFGMTGEGLRMISEGFRMTKKEIIEFIHSHYVGDFHGKL